MADIIIEKHLYTVDDFDRFMSLPGNSERLLELIHGEIIEKVVTLKHGIITVNISTALRNYAKQHRVGFVASEVNHRTPVDPYNDRLPDVSFIADNTIPIPERGSLTRMPDLAVEVKSPSNSYPELRSKAEYYLQNGARLVWLVYPERQIVEVCTLTNEAEIPASMRVQTFGGEDVLDGGDVLPGFTLPVAEIFELS